MFSVFVSAIDLAGKLVTSALTFVPHWGAVSREFEANLSDLVTRTSRMPAFLLRENFALKIEHSNLNPYQALLMRSLQICSNISWSCCWKLWSESRCAQYISNLGIFFPLVSFVFMVFQCFLTFSGFLETWNPETGKLTLTGSKGILITCSIWQQFPGFCCFLEFFEFLLFIATVSSAKIDFICKMFGGGKWAECCILSSRGKCAKSDTNLTHFIPASSPSIAHHSTHFCRLQRHCKPLSCSPVHDPNVFALSLYQFCSVSRSHLVSRFVSHVRILELASW